MKDYITVIGGGLAGSEAAYQIAKRNIKVKLYEMKPYKFSPAHSNKDLAEIVCSNSFKSNLLTNACGLLKEELRRLDSLLIKIADETSVAAGQALAVDREEFSRKVTEEIESNPLIEIINKEVTDIEELAKDGIVIIATGPLTSDDLAKNISKVTGEDKLYFYDAAAPIISKDSINFDIAFYGDRYSEEKKKDETIEEWKERLKKQEGKEQSYINLPMDKDEYEKFYNELVNAEVVTLHDFEKREIFEGCMPIEIMAKRGIDTLRYGPLKPVGFDDPRTNHFPLKNALALYDHYFVDLKFVDFTNKFSGAKLWKGQHPEFETYYNSVHDKAGVSCVQCHMDVVEKDGQLQYTSHFVQSPRYILESTCLTSDCHGTGADKHANWQGKDAAYVKASTNWTKEDAKYSIDSIKTYTTGKMRKAEFWLAELIDAIATAERMGVDKATLDEARNAHTRAHILWEYWTAENSDGFHNPPLARESITNSITISMNAYDALNKAMKAKSTAAR